MRMGLSIDFDHKIFKDTYFFILGGEPFIDFLRLQEVLRVVWNHIDKPVLISTNATLLDREKIDFLRNKKIEIQVSLSGTSKESHDKYCGQGSFDKAIENIKLLVRARIYTIISMVYTKENYREMEDYFKLALSLGVNEVRFIPMRAIGGGEKCLEILPDQYLVFKQLVEILKEKPEYKKILSRDFFSIAMTVCRYSSYRDSCGIGRNVIFLDADGAVYPCPNFTDKQSRCGNLRDKKLSEIVLESPVLNSLRERYNVKNYPICNECDYCHWYIGDCRAETLSVTSSSFAPSPHCTEYQKMYLDLLWLIAEGFNISNDKSVNNIF